ncbi:MAG TPA: serine hydrolase domain-containing protein [Candidatus Acidoferrum sp.]|jgi:CubicO group peptidase (beta-lactamase class C family)
MIRVRGAVAGLAWIFLVAGSWFGGATMAQALSAAAKPAAQGIAAAQVPATPTKPAPQVPTAPVASGKPTPTVPAAAAHTLDAADLTAFFDGIIPLQMERSDVGGASVLVMKDGQILLKKGYGYADVAKKKQVDPDATIFRLASISKLFTWISVMQLAEQGKLDIDADVNKYLDFQIAPAFNRPVTLRNLMTHTGGFEEEIRDIILTDPKQASTLRDFLIANQPRRMYPPGEIPAYSNYGVGLAGYIVQRTSGEPYEQYVAEHIFQPLKMINSSFHEPLQAELAGMASDGYKSSTDVPAIGFEIFNPMPAGGISSTAADMRRFARALLNKGELDGQRILKPETLALMWTRQFAANDAMPAMCMGFYQTWRNGLRFIGHDGDLIAFHSMFLLEPKENLALFISYNSAGAAGKSRGEILDSFADRYYPYAANPVFQKRPLEELKALEGTYESTRRADSTKFSLASLAAQVKVTVSKDGVLKADSARDLRGHVRKWKAIGRDLLQADGDQVRVFAIRDGNGNVVRLATDFAGVQLQRVRWYENAQLIGPLAGISIAILFAVVLASLIRLGRRWLFSKRPRFAAQPGTMWLTAGPRVAAFAWIALLIFVGTLAPKLQSETFLPTHALDGFFVMINVASGLAILLSAFAVIAGVRIWLLAGVRAISRVKFSVVALACLFLSWVAVHWNVLGPAHRF